MGLEARIRPADAGWIAANRDRLAAKIQALPSFVTEKAPGELRIEGLRMGDVTALMMDVITEKSGHAAERGASCQ